MIESFMDISRWGMLIYALVWLVAVIIIVPRVWKDAQEERRRNAK